VVSSCKVVGLTFAIVPCGSWHVLTNTRCPKPHDHSHIPAVAYQSQSSRVTLYVKTRAGNRGNAAQDGLCLPNGSLFAPIQLGPFLFLSTPGPLTTTMAFKPALVLVDVQEDFCPPVRALFMTSAQLTALEWRACCNRRSRHRPCPEPAPRPSLRPEDRDQRLPPAEPHLIRVEPCTAEQ
jgi:hypothetical protein